MSTPTISLLHATKGRPEKALQTMRLWASRAYTPALVEYVIAYNKDDAGTEKALDDFLPGAEMPWFEGEVTVIRGDFAGSAAAWDAAYNVSSGSLLIQVSDDTCCPEHWDTALLNRLPPQWESERLVIAVNDGLRRDKLMTGAILTRAYADWKGEFLHKNYFSMFSDDEFTARSYIDQSRGNCRVIEARDLMFEHQHHVKMGTEPDATYLWTGRPEAYEHGQKLFRERNPTAYGQHAHLWM